MRGTCSDCAWSARQDDGRLACRRRMRYRLPMLFCYVLPGHHCEGYEEAEAGGPEIRPLPRCTRCRWLVAQPGEGWTCRCPSAPPWTEYEGAQVIYDRPARNHVAHITEDGLIERDDGTKEDETGHEH